MQPRWVAHLSADVEHDEAVIDAAILSHLPSPRSPDTLYEKLDALPLRPDDLLVDVGCGYGKQAVIIAARTGCRVLALDQSRQCVANARWAARDARSDAVRVVRAAAEALPIADGRAAVVWCRDMLYYVDLAQTLQHFTRALRPRGDVIVYHTFATEQMEPIEARRFLGPAVVPENMSTEHFEASVREAGLAILERDLVGSEWRETLEAPDGPRTTSAKLLRAARLLRGGEPLRRALGERFYDDHLNDSLWGVYQMLGKLRPTIYVLQRS